MSDSRWRSGARFAFVVIGLVVAAGRVLAAQTHRALLIGIDTYHYGAELSDAWRAHLASSTVAQQSTTERRGDMQNLDGAVSDAIAMRSLLIAKFGFAPANAVLLRNEQATRDGILTAVRQLVESAQRGDLVVFYYAGHGSQQFNSLPSNHFDQTITPADANVGQFDIRNAELTALFNQALDKGAHLTLIFDSCNSGSAVRGIVPSKLRFAPFDPRDAHDGSTPESLTRLGRKNPALVLAAAQEDQSAIEDSRSEHGVFTAALLEVLKNPTNVNAPARQVFQQVEAMLRWRGVAQVPVLKGTSGDADRALFGSVTGPLAGRTILTMSGVTGAAGDTVILDGGAALGVGASTELRLADSTSGPLHLRIVGSQLGTSRAVATSGRIRALPGAVFVVDKWVASKQATLIAWVPPAMGVRQLATAIAQLRQLRQSSSLEWVADPTTVPDDGRPLYTVFSDAGGWKVRTPGRAVVPLTTISESAVSSIVAADQSPVHDSIAKKQSKDPQTTPGAVSRPRLFIMLPPTSALRDGLGLSAGGGLSVQPTSDADSADYALVGRIDGDNASYAWVRPNTTQQQRSRSAFPARTNWVGVRADTAAAANVLAEVGRRLSVLNYWLTVESHSAHEFPYHLALERIDDAARQYHAIGDTIPRHGGESYQVVLRKDTTNREPIDRQWVYVFAIDATGRGQLIFGQSANQLPDSMKLAAIAKEGPNGLAAADLREIPLWRSTFKTCPPYGVDTFVMIASNQPQPSPEAVFNFAPVLTDITTSRGVTRQGAPAPDDWSIERFASRSLPPSPADTALIRRALDGADRCHDDAGNPFSRAAIMSPPGSY
jgi:hypothetical protein